MNLLHFSNQYSQPALIFIGVAIIIFLGFAMSVYYKNYLLVIIALLVIVGSCITSVVLSSKAQDINIKELQNWTKSNYNLTLSNADAKTLIRKGSLITENDNSVEKIELTLYKGGYLLFNDGKAIHQGTK